MIIAFTATSAIGEQRAQYSYNPFTDFVDYQTDSVIQTSLRKELPMDVTVITIAHRLQTIMDADKIVRVSRSWLLFAVT